MVWLLIIFLLFCFPIESIEKDLFMDKEYKLSGLVAKREYKNTIFEMADRSGDDYGSGKLTYPKHLAFAPYKDLFDLLHFQVSLEGDYLLMDLSFGQITNPWKAPEGFFHQHVLIFIKTNNENGLSANIYEPLQMEFADSYELVVRVAPWSLSSLRDARGTIVDLIVAETINEQTIRAYIPLDRFSTEVDEFEYAVFIGGYDPFGKDLFREILVDNTQWEFGGGEKWPFVDLLAPSFGNKRQQEQLRSGIFYFQSNKREQQPKMIWVLVGIGCLGIILTCFFLFKNGFQLKLGLKFPIREHNTKASTKR